MKRLLYLFCLLAPLLAPTASRARPSTTIWENGKSSNKYNYLEDVACSAAESERTVNLDLGRRWEKLHVGVFFTHSSDTTLSIDFQCSIDGTNYAVRQTRNCTSGTCAVSNFTDSKAVTADADYFLEHDVRVCARARSVVTCAGNTGGTFSIQAAATD